MRGYYTGRLTGERLRRVYEIAPARVKQYLEAEICHVLARMPRGGSVLELGCGYGRVAFRLAESLKPAHGLPASAAPATNAATARPRRSSLGTLASAGGNAGSPTSVGPPVFRPVAVIGIDTSADSLILGRLLAPSTGTCQFVLMDASELGFEDKCFDAVVCVQNGICAFSVEPCIGEVDGSSVFCEIQRGSEP
jgi:SAM-dependent methyltransferase